MHCNMYYKVKEFYQEVSAVLEYIVWCLYSHPSSRARACETFCFHSWWGELLLKNRRIFLKANVWIEEGKVKEILFAVGIG